MNRIRRLRRTLARRASSPGRAEPQARQPGGQEPHLAGRTGHDRVAARFIQHAAADAGMAAGQDRSASPDHELPAGFWAGRNGGQTVRRPLVPVLLPATGPALRSRDPVRWLQQRENRHAAAAPALACRAHRAPRQTQPPPPGHRGPGCPAG